MTSSSSRSPIVIAGAGVAGLAAAALLAEPGHRVIVIERASALRAGGYAVDFRGEAPRVLERLGILERLRSKGRDTGNSWYVDREGRRTVRLPAEIMGGDLEVMRGDVLEALRDRATAAGADIRFGTTVTAIERSADTVTVQLDGASTERVEAAVLLGADGVHSTIRRLAFPSDDDGIRTLGFTAAVARVSGDFAANGEEFCSIPGATVGVCAGDTPGTTRAVFYLADQEGPSAADLADPAAFLRRRFERHGWIVPQLLDGLVSVEYLDAMCRVELRRWSAGRVALLGDAAWCASPLSGMGTTLALLGAYAVAAELAAAADPVVALRAAEQRMRATAAAAQKLADGAAAFFVPRSRAMIVLRDLTYRTMRFLPWKGALAAIPDRAARTFSMPNLTQKHDGRLS